MTETLRKCLRNLSCILILAVIGALFLGRQTADRFWGETDRQTQETARTANASGETAQTENAFGETAQTENASGETAPVLEELPAYYDCRANGKMPVVKNQGTLGTCWAVAASSALESSLLPQERAVFSAEHIFRQSGYAGVQENGGAFMMCAAYLTAWKGPILEETDPYGDGISVEDARPVKHVQEIQMVLERDDEKIKRLIYENGAVQSSIHMEMDGEQIAETCYHEQYAAYCYRGEAEVNHDILIIGWDDAYPAGNFRQPPKRDGAFICQNSWGEAFGENGIFYVSYADTGIGKNCAAYTKIEHTDHYDRIYQSDLCGYVGQAGYGRETCRFANVYTADKAETLCAVGFYATGPDSSYEISVVNEFQNTLSLVLAKKDQEGAVSNAGFYTVELEEPVPLEEGQTFAVCVKITTPDAAYPVAMEYKADEATKDVILEDGQGYISPDGYRWMSMEEEYEGNVCLKAYTREE